MFKPGQSQASESVKHKRPVSAHTADSSGSNAFKRARTVSSALLDLLPLASDASTVATRCTSECSAHDIMHCKVAAYVQDQCIHHRHDKGFHLPSVSA